MIKKVERKEKNQEKMNYDVFLIKCIINNTIYKLINNLKFYKY